MKTILQNALDSRAKNTFAELTTVWNYHNVSSFSDLMKSKNSNLHKLVSDKTHLSDEFLKDGLTIVVGAKGRSQHSETQLILFRGDQTQSNSDAYFSFSELEAFGVR